MVKGTVQGIFLIRFFSKSDTLYRIIVNTTRNYKKTQLIPSTPPPSSLSKAVPKVLLSFSISGWFSLLNVRLKRGGGVGGLRLRQQIQNLLLSLPLLYLVFWILLALWLLRIFLQLLLRLWQEVIWLLLQLLLSLLLLNFTF
jgi:hypothetical protein